MYRGEANISGDAASLSRDGFVEIPDVIPQEERAAMSTILADMFNRQAGRERGAFFDMLAVEENDKSRVLNLLSPQHLAPELRHFGFRKRALAIARQLLGDGAYLSFEHVIYKPPFSDADTPWHQDEAFRTDANYHYNQLSMWFPMADVDRDNGCMRYVAGSHLGPLHEHRPFNDDPRAHAIECMGYIDPALVRYCPVKAGSAIAHLGRTIHGSGPNSKNIGRMAYIIGFETAPEPIRGGRSFEWNDRKVEQNQQLRSQWRNHGGIWVEGIQRIRDGALSSPRRIQFELTRALRAVFRRFAAKP